MWRVQPVSRDAGPQRLIDAIDAGLLARPRGNETFQASRKVMAALNRRSGQPAAVAPQRLAVCSELTTALAEAAMAAPPMPEIALAFAAIEPQLAWWRRDTADPADSRFYNGHANASIVGPSGSLEERDDVWLGVSLMAPRVLYPVHDHPPEEVYLALTSGHWWNAGMDWSEPGPGGTIYNPPGIAHAMRSGAKPLLALWLTPTE